MTPDPTNEEALRLINAMARARRANVMAETAATTVKMLPFFIFGFAV
jgi:hypothetical protein